MHVDFEFSGGYANINLIYRGDTEKLPPEIASKLLRLIESSGVLDIQQSEITSNRTGPPDVFFYKLSLYEGGKKKSLSFNDATVPDQLKPLLELLQELAWEQLRKKE
ncbi:MAG TPA: hypothetical protein HA262_12190 [Methanosarcina sp.]|jgi:uncharacterized membrane protein|nr:hypothetical protein [Methanosarcina sp.]